MKVMELRVETPDRLDRFLAHQLPEFSRSKLVRQIMLGEVLVDGISTPKASHKLERGQVVTLEGPEDAAPHDLTPDPGFLDVAYEDDRLMVVNKPRGMAVHPAPTLKEPSLVNRLLARPGTLSKSAGEWRPGIVHRLDKDTTGLLLVAKDDEAHVFLAKQIEQKTAERRYYAVVAGYFEAEKLKIDAPIGRDPKNRMRMAVIPRGKHAVTHITRIKRLDVGTVVEAKLETGRTHQIRVHLMAVGHPVLGDAMYAPKEYRGWPLQLHARFLGFDHPDDGRRLEVIAEPPEDFLSISVASGEALS
jgi:23S rRNA pseudouridine1911/1915/1917 synthase